MSFVIKRDWITKSGLRAMCLLVQNGSHRCGYVAVPVGHVLHGKGYRDELPFLNKKMKEIEKGPIGSRGIIDVVCHVPGKATMVILDVHGGVTYTGGGNGYPVPGNEWWIGFDCAHDGDRTSYSDGITRSTNYVVEQCEKLASQIVELCGGPDHGH
jgi:hypothetical protein